MKESPKTQLKVGIFVLAGVVLISTGILLLGGLEDLFTRYQRYSSTFEQVDGLIPGAKVMLNGIRVGVVEEVALVPNQNTISIHYKVSQDYTPWIRVGSTVELATQGVLGDRYLSIHVGPSDAAPLPEDSVIPSQAGGGLDGFFSEGSDLITELKKIAVGVEKMLDSLNRNQRSEKLFEGLAETASNLKKLSHDLSESEIKTTLLHLKSILRKIDEGDGSVGALINDDQLYADLKLLVGGVNRNRVIRNLVRKTIKDREAEVLEIEKEQLEKN